MKDQNTVVEILKSISLWKEALNEISDMAMWIDADATCRFIDDKLFKLISSSTVVLNLLEIDHRLSPF